VPTHAGTYRWVLTYSGDRNNDPAGPTACGLDSETVVVHPAQPTIVTVASGAVHVGTAISDSAVLAGGAHPTGTITFRLYGPDDATCTGSPAHVSSVEVTHGNDTYHSADFTPRIVGTYRWVAHYSGDHNNEPASSACGDPGEEVVVSQVPLAQPELATTASAGGPAGSPIHDTARLTGGADPTGTITFEVYGPNNPDCAAPPAAVRVVTVHGNGDYESGPFRPIEAGHIGGAPATPETSTTTVPPRPPATIRRRRSTCRRPRR
jgi:hypothetical protein